MRTSGRTLVAGFVVTVLCLAAMPMATAVAGESARPRWLPSGWSQRTHSIGSSLRAGGALTAGESIDDRTAPTQLVMEPDGDLVLFYVPLRQKDPYRKHLKQRSLSCVSVTCSLNRPQRLWHSNTGGHPGAVAEVSSDGVAEIRAKGRTIWTSKSAPQPGATLGFTSRGDLALLRHSSSASSTSMNRGTPTVELVSTAVEASDTAVPGWVAGSTVPQYVGQSLGSGQTLSPGQYLESQNGQYSYYMTPQGAVAEFLVGNACPQYVYPYPADWANIGPIGALNWQNNKGKPPGPFPVAGASLTLTTEGSLNLSSTSAGTDVQVGFGPQGSSFSINNSGEMAFTTAAGTTHWSPTATNTLCPGQTLYPPTELPGADQQQTQNYDVYLHFAPRNHGGYELDTVGGGKVNHVWSDSSAPSTVYAFMQTDGNFVVYPQGQTYSAYWATGTNGDDGAFMTISWNALFAISTATVSDGVATWTVRYTSPNKGGLQPQQITLKIGTYT